MNAADIIKSLYDIHIPTEWLRCDELRVSTGYSRQEQRMDFWAMSWHPSKAYRRHGFEVKISRSDFAREIRKPEKRRPALMLCNRFYFAAPAGVIPVEKLPIDSGLMEWFPDGRVSTTVEAPWLDTEPPTWGFLASIVRTHHKRARE